MSTDLKIEMVTEFVEQKLRNKPVAKLLGEPTFVAYGILEDQVAVAASAVKTLQWGRETRPYGTHRQRGQIPVNKNNNQQCGQTGKTRRHQPYHRREDK